VRDVGALLLAFAVLLAGAAIYLGASKGTGSQATRVLERLGFIRQVSRRGERADYFRITCGV
jgi:DNA-binding transcriptional regulator GbsR (MarR family)